MKRSYLGKKKTFENSNGEVFEIKKKKTFEKPNGEILENQKPFEKSNKKLNKSNQIAFKSTTILLRTPVAQMIFFNQAYGFCFLTFVVVVCLFVVVVFCLNTCEFTLFLALT